MAAPFRRCWAFSLVVLAAITGVSAADDGPKPAATIAPVRAPGNVFGGQEAAFTFRIDATRAVKGRTTWRLAAGTATVNAGEADLTAAPGAAAELAIKLPVPPVKDGVVLQTRLTVSAVEAGQARPVAAFERDVWVFPADPFAGRSDWLKKLKISLYDPPGATAKVLAAANVPFDAVPTLDAVAGVKEGVLVVGEGVSFRGERGLAGLLEKRAAALAEWVLPKLVGPEKK